jgi:hypothetical protein
VDLRSKFDGEMHYITGENEKVFSFSRDGDFYNHASESEGKWRLEEQEGRF